MQGRRIYSDDLITVLVGSEDEKFVVHKSAVCKNSKFFQAACGREWKEGQERVIRLPEADPEVFNVYAHWAYTETLDMSLMPEPSLRANDRNSPPAYINLGKVWILGNFLHDHIVGNRVIDRFLQKLDSDPAARVHTQSLEHIWNNTPQGCGLQRVLLETMAVRITEEDFEKYRQDYPQDFLFELAKNTFQSRKGQVSNFRRPLQLPHAR